MSIRPAASRPATRSVRIDVQGGLKSVEDIRELRLRAGEQTFRLGDIADGQARPRGSRQSPRPAIRAATACCSASSWRTGFNVTDVGAAVESDLQAHRAGRCRSASSSARSPTRPQVVSRCDRRVPAGARRGARHRAGRLVPVARLARRAWSSPSTIPLVLAATFVIMYDDRHRPAAHLARRADHRARPAGRRRDDRRRDDGAQAGGGLRQARRGELRLHLDRLPDADRHADHHGRLHPGRLRGIDRPANMSARCSG